MKCAVLSPPSPRTCQAFVAVPLRVPNPRRRVCLQHRSPVWSQPRSSWRRTCSAPALCWHRNRLKVGRQPLFAPSPGNGKRSVALLHKHAADFSQSIYVNVSLIIQSVSWACQRGAFATHITKYDHTHVTTSDGARWDVTEILSSHPLSCLPPTFLLAFSPPTHFSSVCCFYETKHACEEKSSSWHPSLYIW